MLLISDVFHFSKDGGIMMTGFSLRDEGGNCKERL